MAASAVLGYATVALNGNELGLIGSIIGGVCTIIATLMTISAASRRQKRELRYQRKGSGMTGFLLALVLISAAAAYYFASRPSPEARANDAPVPTAPATAAPAVPPTIGSTTLPPEVPTTAGDPSASDPSITLEEASGFVSSYVSLANSAATEDQAWAMFTDSHAGYLTDQRGGPKAFHSFWDSVDTVTLTGKPSLTPESTPSRAVVDMPLTYRMFPDKIRPGTSACLFDHDDFTVVRVNGELKIADAATDGSAAC